MEQLIQTINKGKYKIYTIQLAFQRLHSNEMTVSPKTGARTKEISYETEIWKTI